jgi:hypothetical protein
MIIGKLGQRQGSASRVCPSLESSASESKSMEEREKTETKNAKGNVRETVSESKNGKQQRRGEMLAKGGREGEGEGKGGLGRGRIEPARVLQGRVGSGRARGRGG